MDDGWARLERALADLAEQAPLAPSGGRLGATLALLAEVGDPRSTEPPPAKPGGGADGRGSHDPLDLEIIYTRRRDDLRQHPGQISLPGGRVDPGETIVQAALREATEEVALDVSTVDVLGELPAFYIPPSRFWLHTVVARWARPHPLTPDPSEVAEILVVTLAQLRDPQRWRVTRLATRGEMWAWQLDDGHLLWGATAVVTSVLLELLDPDWTGGARLEDLPAGREVQPWKGADTVAPRPGPARLGGVPQVPVEAVTPPADAEAGVADTGWMIANVVRELLGPERRRVLVLAGNGGTGSVGLHAAAALHAGGIDVHVVRPAGAGPVRGDDRQAARSLGDRVGAHDGPLPPCDLVLDALVGRGLDGPLHGPARDLVMALRELAGTVVSIDVPSGVDPRNGLVGDAVAADVTLALGGPAGGLLLAGLGPFVGDLYVVAEPAAGEAADPVVRVVRGKAS